MNIRVNTKGYFKEDECACKTNEDFHILNMHEFCQAAEKQDEIEKMNLMKAILSQQECFREFPNIITVHFMSRYQVFMGACAFAGGVGGIAGIVSMLRNQEASVGPSASAVIRQRAIVTADNTKILEQQFEDAEKNRKDILMTAEFFFKKL